MKSGAEMSQFLRAFLHTLVDLKRVELKKDRRVFSSWKPKN